MQSRASHSAWLGLLGAAALGASAAAACEFPPLADSTGGVLPLDPPDASDGAVTGDGAGAANDAGDDGGGIIPDDGGSTP